MCLEFISQHNRSLRRLCVPDSRIKYPVSDKSGEIDKGFLCEDTICLIKRATILGFLFDYWHTGIQFTRIKDTKVNSKHLELFCETNGFPTRAGFQKFPLG